MRNAKVFVHSEYAGDLSEIEPKKSYRFTYHDTYNGPAVSLTMPITQKIFEYKTFPPFFEGLLPEGPQLEGLLRQAKIDKNDLFSQLIVTGQDLIGAVTVEERDE